MKKDWGRNARTVAIGARRISCHVVDVSKEAQVKLPAAVETGAWSGKRGVQQRRRGAAGEFRGDFGDFVVMDAILGRGLWMHVFCRS
jgi:hypothetical protein